LLFIVDPSSGEQRGADPAADDVSRSAASRPETEEEFAIVERALAEHREEQVRLEGESEIPGRSIGGVSGRPMNRRNQPADVDDTEAAEHTRDGGMQGTNRSPKVLQKQRKNRVA
jgi:hypothetical protein